MGGCGHICMDEVYVIFGVIAGIKLIPGWIRLMWAKRHTKPNCIHNHEHK